jgi:hypothetical protein
MATVYIAWQSSSGSSLIRNLVYFIVGTRVLDPHHFSTDPDPAFQFNANPIQLFTLMLIRNQLFTLIRIQLFTLM